MTAYPNLYYINSYSTGVCVKECPTVANGIDATNWIGVDGVVGASVADYANVEVYPSYTGDNNQANFPSGFSFPALDSTSYMNRCTFTGNATTALEAYIKEANGQAMQAGEEGTLTKIYGDLYDSMNYILGFGFCVAMVVSFAYSFLLRIPGVLFLMIWGCIGTVFAMILGMGAYAYVEAEAWRTEEVSSVIIVLCPHLSLAAFC